MTKDINSQYVKNRPEGSFTIKRIEELGKSKIDVALEMIIRVMKRKLAVDYVLADSWFVSEKFIAGILIMKLNIIGLII